MNVDEVAVILAVIVPFLLVAEGFLAVIFWRWNGWEAPRFLARGRTLSLAVTWFVVSTLSVWCVYVMAFVAVHALLFTLGQPAAVAGLALSVLLVAAVPIVWAFVILRRAGHPATHS